MTGGKRLSEEERNDMDKMVVWAQERIGFARDGTRVVREGALDEIERTLKKIASYLKRDDEPEYCTCAFPDGSRVHHSESEQECPLCGKPVKGE